MTITLQTFLQSIHLPEISQGKNEKITGLAIDSREIKPGYVFFALPGCRAMGCAFIDDAIEKGAIVVIADSEESTISYRNSIPIIPVKHLRNHLGSMIAGFYALEEGVSQTYLETMRFVGITGTSGKTSCMHLLTEALNRLGENSAMMGTIGYGKPNQLKPQELTTPAPLTLQNQLHQFSLQGVKTVVMEASSHALDQDRVSDIPFFMGIYTNLSRDHLDYHHDMESYARAKRRLFEIPSLKQAVINLDDSVGHRWAQEFSDRLQVCGYSRQIDPVGQFPFVVATKKVLFEQGGIMAEIETPWGSGSFKSQFLGGFNLSNLLAVISSLGLMGFRLEKILEVVERLTPVIGRMQLLGGGDHPLVVIDFSHKPAALENALLVLREHCKGNLVVVFGCGGDRDSGKRPMMGEIAERLADKVIITDDNVRTEDPVKITNDILAGCHHPDRVRVIHDRVLAINAGIENATSKDVILLAGKGHEQYQVIGDKKLPFNEVAIVKKALGESNQCLSG